VKYKSRYRELNKEGKGGGKWVIKLGKKIKKE
jgi:hypothetical protein